MMGPLGVGLLCPLWAVLEGAEGWDGEGWGGLALGQSLFL